MIIERLNETHNRSVFDCGEPSLDDFLKTKAGQFARRDIGVTYVAVEESSNAVLGYYTITVGAVARDNMPEAERAKLPRYPVPCLHLGRLAVARSAQGRGLGEALLMDALSKSLIIASEAGVHVVEVVAIDDRARAFYERYGFRPLEDDRLHLYLAVKVIRNLGL